MKEKEKLGKRLRRALEIDEVLGESDTLELRGMEELTVHGCRRILHYGEEEIRLSMKKYILSIVGEGLYCASFYNGAVRVSGRIKSLEFDERCGK